MQYVSQIAFLALLAAATWFFIKQVKTIRRNIFLGRDLDLSDQASKRWLQMTRVALGQGKMTKKPVAGILHIIVYVGFVLINIEVLEILIDGISGTHRVFAFLGSIYTIAIGFFEILAALVLIACVLFIVRRHVLKIGRFGKPEMQGWPTKDALIILITEVVLMGALLKMNACDQILQARGVEHYTVAGSFPISQYLVPIMQNWDTNTLIVMERIFWWFHIIGIFAFLNYLPKSKHWHIIMSFPTTYYAPLKPKGQLANMESVNTEIKLMMDPNASPPEGYEAPEGFGAKDVQDLSWKNLMDAYTCTECGRCTSACPANITGKKLSPRKIMMDTRDRLEEVGRNLDSNKTDDKNLHSYITTEELWACTTCNACTEACPINLNPLDIIIQMRQYQVMELSNAPAELNSMMSNLENNGAPWQMSQMDKGNWAQID